MKESILLNTAYFPPIPYFSMIKKSDDVQIEQYDHYGKQSYRNRCNILTANGPMSLSIPIQKGPELKQLTKDVRIDYSTPWQKLHFKGIESAYKNSPFYEYYIDDLQYFFQVKEAFLIDLNHQILGVFLKLLSLHPTLTYTSDFDSAPTHRLDLRDAFHPKPSRRRTVTPVNVKPYHQTFAERFPFIPELSVLDLLFNTGPEALSYL